MLYICIALFILLLAAIFGMSRMMDQLDELTEANNALSGVNENMAFELEWYALAYKGKPEALSPSWYDINA